MAGRKRCGKCGEILSQCTCKAEAERQTVARATLGIPAPLSRVQYIRTTGNTPNWKSWPEDLREKIKLNVRIVPSRLAQVRELAVRLSRTMEEVIVMALDALQKELDERDATSASEREIMAEVRKGPPPRE